MSNYHNPVLLHASIDYLITDASATYVDVTFGGGGHSLEILNRLSPSGKLVAFDQDSAAQANIIADDRFVFVASNFRNLKKYLQYHQCYPCQGILADLGISSHQIDTPDRGFSYRYDADLDMRMNRQKGITAQELINTYPQEKLAQLFYTYGELSMGGRIAAAIVKERLQKSIDTTSQLVKIVTPLLPRGKENKCLSQLFQALRIEVNEEMASLKEFLLQCTEALLPGGRLVVISYHSLEDRLVKNFIKTGNLEGVVEKDFFGNPLTPFTLISRKHIVPSEEEIAENPRARSSKLRIVEKK
jgi:16S rRNA (cytosine1402-N4)-methyltransferase